MKETVAAADIDELYNSRLDRLVRSVQRKHSYDAVLVEYVFMSKALDLFDDGVLKIIDTHDVFSGRREKYSLRGIEDRFFSTTEKEEARGLDRADRIIAIQDHERAVIGSMTKREVSTVGHTVLIEPNAAMRARPRAVCVATANPANIHGMQRFIAEILPCIRRRIPDFELVMAGKIGDAVDDAPGLIRLGELPDLGAAYAEADLAINPVEVGTGLKIKSIEALGFGKPLVTGPVGAEGLEDAAGGGLFIVSSPEEWAEKLSELIADPLRYREAATAAHRSARMFNEKAIANLQRILR